MRSPDPDVLPDSLIVTSASEPVKLPQSVSVASMDGITDPSRAVTFGEHSAAGHDEFAFGLRVAFTNARDDKRAFYGGSSMDSVTRGALNQLRVRVSLIVLIDVSSPSWCAALVGVVLVPGDDGQGLRWRHHRVAVQRRE